MKKLALNKEFSLYERNGEPVCSSRQVAETFGKRHDNVLRDIKDIPNLNGDLTLKSEERDITIEFWKKNFFESTYKSRGKEYPVYFMTRDGFSYLVMGYTGQKASEFKIAYINRFNQMEDFIETLTKAKLSHPAFTKAIEEAHEDPKFYHYSTEADMINRIVLGIPAKTFREEVGLKKGESIRPFLSQDQIDLVEELQRVDIGLLAIGMGYQERKTKLTMVAHRRILKQYKALKEA